MTTKEQIELVSSITIPMKYYNYLVNLIPTRKVSLEDELEADIIQPEIEEIEIEINPFERNYKTWTPEEEKIILYCANSKTLSLNTLDYLKRKLSKDRTDLAIRSKLLRMGYRIKRGRIVKK